MGQLTVNFMMFQPWSWLAQGNPSDIVLLVDDHSHFFGGTIAV